MKQGIPILWLRGVPVILDLHLAVLYVDRTLIVHDEGLRDFYQKLLPLLEPVQQLGKSPSVLEGEIKMKLRGGQHKHMISNEKGWISWVGVMICKGENGE